MIKIPVSTLAVTLIFSAISAYGGPCTVTTTPTGPKTYGPVEERYVKTETVEQTNLDCLSGIEVFEGELWETYKPYEQPIDMTWTDAGETECPCPEDGPATEEGKEIIGDYFKNIISKGCKPTGPIA